ncbi:type II toxin-antitoxin system HicB family antitoxin [Paenibacillus sp. GCM10027626]|uniref:type II toxin-antitoxin system HicB family antitoxin n=1 Tax=Paenibacillus sp. GCM10027626 TaxID=3273411 RepID=UPI00363B3201
MLKDRYVYPAVFDYTYDNTGQPEAITVTFPNLPGAITEGSNEEEAVHNAKECLSLHLYGMERDGDEIPSPSSLRDITLDSADQVVTFIDVWMPPFRDHMAEKAVKKTLTIPRWLDDLATEQNVNFSRVLQDGLKSYLGVSERKVP